MAAAPSPPPQFNVDDIIFDEEVKPKFHKNQKVFAKDEASGILYEAVVRRCMYSVDRQLLDKNPDMEEREEWHCFVHYVGWNVKWDRWCNEASLYEMTDKNKALAQALQQAVKDAKKKHGVKSPQVMKELEQTMKRLELERRLDERREELAKQGIVMGEEDEAAFEEEKRTKYNKAYFEKELKLREHGLTNKRKQAHAEKLVLPFPLKKVMVEEWEVIQCNMIPNLPVDDAITVRQVLDDYLVSKIGHLPVNESDATVPVAAAASATMEATGDSEPNSDELESTESVQGTVTTVETTVTTDSTEDDELAKKRQEWQEMTDGVALLFDRAVGARNLLYRQELPLHEWIQQHSEYGARRYCQVYGCEHLLRLFIRLPAMLAGELSEAETRPVYAKLDDFVRFLKEHQSKYFRQSYQEPLDVEESVPRKRAAVDGTGKSSAKRSRKGTPKRATATVESAQDQAAAPAETSGVEGQVATDATPAEASGAIDNQ